MQIGILAYGSLIDEPEEEIRSVIAERKDNVRTPFRVEFARSSKSRDYAPTLVPFDAGAYVNSVVFVLNEEVSELQAMDRLWRRETNQVHSNRNYKPPSNPGPDDVIIEKLEDFHGIRIVLYTRIAPNIPDLTPRKLAELAIQSARAEAGAQRRDGISYLIAAKHNGILTPLMPEYETEILLQTNAQTLEEAFAKCRQS